MKGKENKDEVSVVINQSFVLIGIVMLCLVFALGYLLASKGDEQMTVFTKDELDRIIQLQDMEDKDETGASICAGKDENGNLVISWIDEDDR